MFQGLSGTWGSLCVEWFSGFLLGNAHVIRKADVVVLVLCSSCWPNLGKPVAHSLGRLRIKDGGMVACCFGLLGLPGDSNGG